MTYQVIDQLANDPGFNTRIGSCCTEQAMVFKDDARPAYVSLADAILLGTVPNRIFVRIIASAPGVADKAATDVEASIRPWPLTATSCPSSRASGR